jgi:outer membrane putative beta-barrel porin/alpha-amylase
MFDILVSGKGSLVLKAGIHSRKTFLHLLAWLALVLCADLHLWAQGGPPFYTNDPGTPGHLNWEINVGYMPFLYNGQSVSHVPDLDINFGVGERIQLTYENAWLRVRDSSPAKFGLGQSNPGVKWRFYDAGEGGLAISVFPQFFLNNPDDAVRRGITPASQSFLLPAEFTKKFGPVDVDYEFGYQFVHRGPDGWITGVVVGHDFTPKLEGDMEFYAQGTFHPAGFQPTLDVGGRYKLKPSIILLLMAGHGLEHADSNEPSFFGYFGVQFLFSSKPHKSD